MGNDTSTTLFPTDTATKDDMLLYNALKNGDLAYIKDTLCHSNINPNATVQSIPIFFYIPLFCLNHEYSFKKIIKILSSKIDVSIKVTENYNLVCAYDKYINKNEFTYDFVKDDKITEINRLTNAFIPLNGINFESFLYEFRALICEKMTVYYRYFINRSHGKLWKNKLTCLIKRFDEVKQQKIHLITTSQIRMMKQSQYIFDIVHNDNYVCSYVNDCMLSQTQLHISASKSKSSIANILLISSPKQIAPYCMAIYSNLAIYNELHLM